MRLTIFVIAFLGVCTCFTCKNEVDEVKDALLKFGIDLYNLQIRINKNVLVTPVALKVTLCLLALGAKGKTTDQIADAIYVENDADDFKDTLKALAPLLNDVNVYGLRNTLRLYLEEEVTIKPKFLQVVTDIKAEIKTVKFEQEETIVASILEWLAQVILGTVDDVLVLDDLDDETNLLVVNAINFQGYWLHPFDKKYTYDDKFWVNKNEFRVKNILVQAGAFAYLDLPKLKIKILELPYKNLKAKLRIVLPYEKNGLAKVEDNLEKILKIRGFVKTDVLVKLPKITVAQNGNIRKNLKCLGIKNPFTDKARFTKITTDSELELNSVHLATSIKFDEEGTKQEGQGPILKGGEVKLPKPLPDKKFECLHPFLFYVEVDGKLALLGRYIH